MDFKSNLLDALAYWERKRLIYNLVLAMLVVICWGADIFMGGPRDWLAAAVILLLFAGLANVLYCAAYPVDLILQVTPLKHRWLQARWLLFGGGLSLASGLAVFVMLRPGMA